MESSLTFPLSRPVGPFISWDLPLNCHGTPRAQPYLHSCGPPLLPQITFHVQPGSLLPSTVSILTFLVLRAQHRLPGRGFEVLPISSLSFSSCPAGRPPSVPASSHCQGLLCAPSLLSPLLPHTLPMSPSTCFK